MHFSAMGIQYGAIRGEKKKLKNATDSPVRSGRVFILCNPLT